MKKRGYILSVAFVSSIVLALALFCWLKKPDISSDSERRKLNQLPEVTTESVITGKVMSEFDNYAMDQFAFRDAFRTLKSFSKFFLFSQKDNNGIYLKDGYAAKLEYPLNENSVKNATDKFEYLYQKYMADKNSSIYFTVVPDKSYFLAEENGFPSMDYERLFSMVKENTKFADYIDITDCLELSDYYKTDTHWRQEKIIKVAKKIAKKMNFIYNDFSNYNEKVLDNPFYGVYYGQSALPLKSEKIKYLTNDIIEKSSVYNAENKKYSSVYDLEKAESKDPYEIFLSGASALLTINNEQAKAQKELIVFRDSFASSLIPLFIEEYSKITLVDIRYITSDYLENFLTFDNKDVLFIYSTLILNNSSVLR